MASSKMKVLFLGYILLYFSGIQAFERLTGCSVGNKQGTCMSQSDCFSVPFRSEECGNNICCLETSISYRKCFKYGKKLQAEISLNRTRYRIIGGTSVDTNEFPFMVAIGKEPHLPDEQKWFCGGSIVSENFVLTAAHCIEKENIRDYMILAGTTSLDSPKAQLRFAAQVIVHPKFTPWKMGYDLALVRLTKPFQLSLSVSPLCLLRPSILPIVVKAMAIGFGVEKEGIKNSLGRLMKVKLDIFSPEECGAFYPAIVQYGGYKPSMLCAGFAGGGKDTCQGDSGGPLVVPFAKPLHQYGLLGVTSAGLSCGLPNSPGLYIKVPYFLAWIERNIWTEEMKKLI